MLFGSGNNGKSVFIKLIESFVGRQNTSHVALQDIDGDGFASADLFRKLVNVFADLSGNGTAQGSGFIYDKKGHIVTNNHVVPDTSNTANKLVDVANKL